MQANAPTPPLAQSSFTLSPPTRRPHSPAVHTHPPVCSRDLDLSSDRSLFPDKKKMLVAESDRSTTSHLSRAHDQSCDHKVRFLFVSLLQGRREGRRERRRRGDSVSMTAK